MNELILIYFGIIGATAGSFISAVVWRLRKNRDFIKSRSECEKCHHKLSPFDLIPVISFWFLRGKCRYCHKKIAKESLVMEIIYAIIFALSWLVFGDNLLKVLIWLFCLIPLGMLALYDFHEKILPNKLIIILTIPAVIWFLLSSQNITEFLFALLPITGIYSVIYLLTNGKGIGAGDIKLGVPLALLLNWQQALLVLFLANVFGLIWYFITKNPDKQFAFGPPLIIATVIVFLLQNWTKNLVVFML